LAIRIYVDDHTDNHYDPDILRVIESYGAELNPVVIIRDETPYWGNNHNLLESYREAYRSEAKYVFMVEEDIMIAKDFFTWHYFAQEKYHPFVSVGCTHVPKEKYEAASDTGCYFSNGYSSLGVCIPRIHLAMLLEHSNPDYYAHLNSYLVKHFPNSSYGDASGAQDGLIGRIMEAGKLVAVLPDIPRAYHAGYYGYNRSMDRKAVGTLQQKIEEVGKVMESRAELTKDYSDCEPCDL
jgi:hypothetical protein